MQDVKLNVEALLDQIDQELLKMKKRTGLVEVFMRFWDNQAFEHLQDIDCHRDEIQSFLAEHEGAPKFAFQSALGGESTEGASSGGLLTVLGVRQKIRRIEKEQAQMRGQIKNWFATAPKCIT